MWERFLERWRELTREQQVSAVVLTVCGFLAIGLSLVRLQAHVSEPFLVQKDSLLATKQLIGETQVQKDDRLKRIDTDGDGLSDWDEINTYHTNPNLRDTCGDGLPDNIRVATGKNLTCDTSKTPSGAGVIDTSGVQNGSNVLSPIDVTGLQADAAKSNQALLQQSAPGSSPADAQAADAAGVQSSVPRDPTAIRAMLKGQVDDAKLNALSDDQLLKLYDKAFADASSTIAASSTAP